MRKKEVIKPKEFTLSYSMFSKTDKGLCRPNNEDEASYLDREYVKIGIIADGMGGHRMGEVASRIAKDTIIDYFNNNVTTTDLAEIKKHIKKAVKEANSVIHRLSSRNEKYYGMGTTLVMALIFPDYTLIVNCGDSRCYTYSKDRGIHQETVDQTVVQYLYKLGAITKEEIKTNPKRHVLMNALGISPHASYDLNIINKNYDDILLCSDGLSNMVEEAELEKIFDENEGKNAEELTNIFIKAALKNGGIDNIGVTVMEVAK